MLERILLHWDTETGIFGVKDRTLREDTSRYAHVEGAMARSVLDNTLCNLLRAPVFDSFWPAEAPLSHRLQFWRDHPDYCPMLQTQGSDAEPEQPCQRPTLLERGATWLEDKIRALFPSLQKPLPILY